MADDLQNYKLQLQQVEAALLTDPENKELLKLKVDLEEVIELTQDLKTKATSETSKSPELFAGQSPDGYEGEDDITASLLAVERLYATNKFKKHWRVGDICMAKWNDNGQYYEAKIDHITGSGQVHVTFEAYKNRGLTTIQELKEFTGVRKNLSEAEKRKHAKLNNKEYLKKKKQKKQQRFKELEEERESEKKKWLAFSTKASKGKKSGIKGKSIFASPENANGRVGIGTCGISGKPMTEFASAEKWKKGN